MSTNLEKSALTTRLEKVSFPQQYKTRYQLQGEKCKKHKHIEIKQ